MCVKNAGYSRYFCILVIMKVQIISLFPEVFKPLFSSSMLEKASRNNLVSFEYINLRDFGLGPRKSVDDTPYGGGDGMVLMVEPLTLAIEKARDNDPNAIVILPTPRGRQYKQSEAIELARSKGLIIVCAHYEGYDERVTDYVDRQYSIGNYVLTGGEIPAMTIVDSVVRLIPGVLGGPESAANESFQDDDQTIEHPHYTRPEEFRGQKVPEVLLTGHHQNIRNWREDNKRK